MKTRTLRITGLAVMLASASLCSAQQTGVGQPNSTSNINVTGFSVSANGSPACGGAWRNFQAVVPSTPWNQSYGGIDTYFTLPAGNGAQVFGMDIWLYSPNIPGSVYMGNSPEVKVFIDGSLCTSCSAVVTNYTTSQGGYSVMAHLQVTHSAGYSWDTDGIHEFGLRFRFPPLASPSLDVRFKAVMEGLSFTNVLGRYDAPALPLFILRDPPGDGSFSSMTTGSSTCFGHSRSVTSGTEEGGWFKTKLGVAGETGFIVTTAFEFSVEIGVSMNATQTTTSEFEYQTCLQTTEEFTTADDGTPDDVFIGNAVRYKYGVGTVIERPTCGTITKHAYFISAPDSTLLSYNYTESYIRGTVIPQIEQQIALFTPGTVPYKRAVNQRDVWVQTLEMNQAIKATAPLSVVRSFNGGGIGVQHQLTTTTTASRAIDYNVSLETGLSLEFGLEIGGSGISAGGDLKMRSEYGKGESASNTVTNTMAYTLRDDDVYDNFNVQVRKDPVFGSYAFLLDSATSRTSCRYEGGYQLDQPSLSVGTPGNVAMTVNEAPVGMAANFPLIICNNSDITRTYYLRFSAVSNAQGAVLQAFGNTLNSNDNGIPLELLAGQCITTNLSLTQPNASVVDFNNITLYLYSLCDEEYQPYIRSYATISAFFGTGNFGSYCIPASPGGTSYGDFVDGVQIGAIDNTGTGATDGPIYTNYSSQFSTPLSRNAQYIMTVTSGAYGDNGYAAWIDYDHDGVFEPSERLGAFACTAPYQPNNIAFTVPPLATLGATIMRVRATYGIPPMNMEACVAYEYGETEDYAVVINANAPQDCLGMNNGSALPGTPCNDNNAATGNDTWNANCLCVGIPLDCVGVPGGPAVPGTECNDGNPNTADDMFAANCICVGTPYDCVGVVGGTTLPGSPCNDGNAATGNDVYGANCICAGQLIDCAGTPGGAILPGTACDDGNPLSGGDAYNANCLCAGQITIDCSGVENGDAQPGTPCDDGNPATGNDLFAVNCICTGVPYDCAGNPGGTQLPGTPCDDGNPNSQNDAFTANCACVGSLAIDCAGVQGGTAQPGSACDDGDTATGNDTYNAFCVCSGLVIDCEGVAGGLGLPGNPCDDGDWTTGNDVWSANCLCAGLEIDCEGVAGGTNVPGTGCNDGNAETTNDSYNLNCVCVGILAFDCTGVINGPAQPGTPCDDGDPDTGEDTYDAGCACSGLPLDCEGTAGGGALPGTACNDGEACTINDALDGSCICMGTALQLGTVAGDVLVYTGTTNTYSVTPVPGATSYAWTLPSGWNSNSTTDFALVAQAPSTVGSGNICVDVQVGACVLTACLPVNVELSTGLDPANNAADAWFTVRPNPSDGVFQLIPGNEQLPMSVTVYDGTGRVVKAPLLVAGKRTISIDLGEVAMGTYYLLAVREGAQHAVPLVISR